MAKHGNPKRKKSHPFDRAHKRMCSNQKVVVDILKCLMPPDMFERLDLTTLEKFPREWMTGGLNQSVADSVWQVRREDDGEYALVLIKFQSKMDSDIVSHMLDYAAILKRKWMRMREHVGPSPLVLPVVLYNGDRDWNVTPEYADLTSSYEDWVKEFELELKTPITSGQQHDPPKPGTNVFAHMICLTSAHTIKDLIDSFAEVRRAVASREWHHALCENFLVWINRAGRSKFIVDIDLWKNSPDRISEEEALMTGNVARDNMARIEQQFLDKAWEDGRKEGQRELAERTIPMLIEAGVSEDDICSRLELTLEEFEEFRNGGIEPDGN